MNPITNARHAAETLVVLTLAMLPVAAQADSLADNNQKIKVRGVAAMQAEAFGLQEVQLLDGPFKHAMELDHRYLLSLEVDRLLHDFRVNAGLPSTAKPLGGWEAPDCELRGHFVGHFLSACALMYASTGDKELAEKGRQVVAGLAECQAKLGNGYLSAYPETFIERVEKRTPVWAPYYTLHKIFAGLEDMYVYCDDAQALEVATKFGDWVIARNSKLSPEQMQAMLDTEHGGMNETLADLYAVTGEQKYLKISLRFNHRRVIEPAAAQEDKLTGLHANTQIPKFIGTARQYELTADPSLKTASLFFWNTVTKNRSYVIGGHSDGEMFTRTDSLSRALGRNTTETCNTYNMLKLTRHLFCWEPNAEYADYYERALFNHILASQNPETGMMCYYVPLRSGSRREFNTPNDSFWCCTGTGVENHAKYCDSIYFHDAQNLYVNLFIASELTWAEKALKLRQVTSFPDMGESELEFLGETPVALNLQVRHPFWATSGFEVSINNEKQPASVSGNYLTLRRLWKKGDRVQIHMPFSLRAEGFKDNPKRFALLNGPLVLSAAVAPRTSVPVVVGDEAALLAGLTPIAGKPNTFRGPTSLFRVPGEQNGEEVILAPFYKAYNEHYVTYWDRYSAAEWAEKQEEFKKQQAAQRELEARTVDYVQVGEEQDERDHNLRGEAMDTREFDDRVWRFASTNGWFSWDLKSLPGQPQELAIEFGGARAEGTLEVLAGDRTVLSQSLHLAGGEQGGSTNIYALPGEGLSENQKITVKFRAPAQGRGIRVAGLRVLKTVDKK